MNKPDYEDQLLNTPYPKPDAYGSLSMPVYNAAAYEFKSAADMEAAFCGQTTEHTYSRISNPTVQYFEERVKQISGAFGVTALNSGMAAISNVFMSIAWSGANIITSNYLFGNTYSFFANTLKAFDVEVRFCDLTNEKDIRDNIDDNTCAIFLEIITNPQMEVVDLKSVSAIAREKHVPVIADTTLISFSAFSAKNFGVDIEVVSGTKYISGGATSIGGLIIDYAAFDWAKNRRLNPLAKEHGNCAFHYKLRKEIHRNFGAYMDPRTAYLQTMGLETMHLRYEKQSQTCLQLAKRLQTLPGIESVNYTGLPDNPFFELSCRQFGKTPGAMLTFNLESKEACFQFLDKLKSIRRATNLFDNKSLAIHPASTIYGNFSQSQRDEMNVSSKTIRLSVGLESADFLLEDIKQALATVVC
ncbi:MAG: PLP-dependent transferase [Bacteroidia bacterium]|nr:PLP-dependent transferase [Bacteroidia bacterium]